MPSQRTPEDELLQGELVSGVRNLLAEMKADDVTILLAKYLDRDTLQALADRFGVSLEAMRSRLARARREFRSRYESWQQHQAHPRSGETSHLSPTIDFRGAQFMNRFSEPPEDRPGDQPADDGNPTPPTSDHQLSSSRHSDTPESLDPNLQDTDLRDADLQEANLQSDAIDADADLRDDQLAAAQLPLLDQTASPFAEDLAAQAIARATQEFLDHASSDRSASSPTASSPTASSATAVETATDSAIQPN